MWKITCIASAARAARAAVAGRFRLWPAASCFKFIHIERFTKVKIQRGRPPTQSEVEEARAHVFLDKLRATLQSGEFKRQDHLIERLLEEGFTSTDIASALLHQLQGGETMPAAKSSRQEPRARPERAPFREPPIEGVTNCRSASPLVARNDRFAKTFPMRLHLRRRVNPGVPPSAKLRRLPFNRPPALKRRPFASPDPLKCRSLPLFQPSRPLRLRRRPEAC